MLVPKSMKSTLVIFMALLMSNIPHFVSAQVAKEMITTTAVVESLTNQQYQEKIRVHLEREDVREALLKMNISPEETSMRLATLSHSELQDLSQQMDAAQYGASVTGILVIVLLVILIIYLAKRI